MRLVFSLLAWLVLREIDTEMVERSSENKDRMNLFLCLSFFFSCVLVFAFFGFELEFGFTPRVWCAGTSIVRLSRAPAKNILYRTYQSLG